MSILMSQIKEKAQHWEVMDRTNEDKRAEAEQYYKENIMPLLVRMFRESESEVQNCEHLILTLGTSYEPIVFSILGLRPKKILILFTAETRDKLDDVIYFTGIKASQYTLEEVDSENILILYEKIKNYYEKQGRPQNIYADFTGGTKAMSAGCAMAASLIGAKAVYIASDYSSQLRKPTPGSERICFVKNPYEVFGDMERKEAISLFNKMDYKTAYHIFCELDHNVPATKQYKPLKNLSFAYDQWDSLNISKALEGLTECKHAIENELSLNEDYLLAKHLNIIKKQIEHLNKINSMDLGGKINNGVLFQNIKYLIFTLYQNALRREAQGKYEMASLLLYRILEMLSQSRFWRMGIDTEKVKKEQYNALGINPDSLLRKINNIKKKIGDKPLDALPQEISLIMGYIILGVLDDELIKTDNENMLVGRIKEIKGRVISRNVGIFAHGFKFQDKDSYEKFKYTVTEYLMRYCEVEGIDMDEISKESEFISL